VSSGDLTSGVERIVRYRGAKTITAALHIGDVILAGLFSIERFTQRSYLHAETDFFHNDVRPNLGDELLVSDHFSGAFDQRQKNIESPGAQLDGVFPSFKKTLRWVQPEWPEGPGVHR
jgi:hypothetical protein